MAERNTMQKEIILHTLRDMGGHPSAAAVYDRVHQRHPTISRSTVYRVLARMAGEGRILRLELGGSDSRYDGETAPHDHVRCRLCGAVEDLPSVELPVPKETRGFLLEDHAVIYRGLCPACRMKVRPENDSYAVRRL